VREAAGGSGPDEIVGMVVVDKEPGCTSHDVVARCRRLFGQRRVGHAGTLDPDATGILLVGLGRATRLLRFLTALGKSYEAEIVLGASTTTHDASGQTVETWDMSGVTIDDVRRAAATLTGRIEQVPPMVSALSVGGRRLHELARAGQVVERAARPVMVDRFDVLSATTEKGVYRVAVDCSSGTYVRVLAADLGTALGGGAHLRCLRRTRVGSFSLDEAHKLDELSTAHVLSPAQAVRDLDHVEVDGDGARHVAHGLALDRVVLGARGDGPWAVIDRTGTLLAVYRATETDRMKPECVLVATG
jgi:tRNA pseudouridine55 synthase